MPRFARAIRGNAFALGGGFHRLMRNSPRPGPDRPRQQPGAQQRDGGDDLDLQPSESRLGQVQPLQHTHEAVTELREAGISSRWRRLAHSMREDLMERGGAAQLAGFDRLVSTRTFARMAGSERAKAARRGVLSPEITPLASYAAAAPSQMPKPPAEPPPPSAAATRPGRHGRRPGRTASLPRPDR